MTLSRRKEGETVYAAHSPQALGQVAGSTSLNRNRRHGPYKKYSALFGWDEVKLPTPTLSRANYKKTPEIPGIAGFGSACYNQNTGMKSYLLDVVMEKDADGYFAYCPSLQGCYSQGATYEEALDNIRDAMKLHLEDRIASGESVPSSQSISVTSLEVAL